MEERIDVELFERTPVPRAVAKLAVPTVMSSLVMILYNLADTYFVGMLNNPVQNAAVTLSAPVLLAFNAVSNLFGVGCSSLMSRALGRKDYETVRKTSSFGFWCAAVCGLLLSLGTFVFQTPLLRLLGADAQSAEATAGYLNWVVVCGAAPSILNVVLSNMVRSEGAAFHASIGTMSGCILNMILDPIFILPWGFDMGAAGAGLATFLSNCGACLYFFVLLFVKRGRTYLSVNPRQFTLNKEIISGVCVVGIPASIQNLLNVTGMTVLNNLTSGYGVDAVAAMGIAQKINMIPMYIALGVSQGIMPLLSYTYSSKRYGRMKKSMLFSLKIALGVMLVSACAFILGADFLTSMFLENESVISYGAAFLRGFCLSQPFMCVDFMAVAVFQASGKGKEALMFALLRKVLLEIPALLILNHLFQVYGLPYAQLVAEVVLACAAALLLKRFFGKLTGNGETAEA